MATTEEGERTSPAPAEVISRLEGIRADAQRLLVAEEAAKADARAAYEADRERVVKDQLATMPLEALKKASDGRLRLGAIEKAGITTVAGVRSAGAARLQMIQGVGSATASQALAAADQVESALRKATRVRFDVDGRPVEQATLLAALRMFVMVQQTVLPLVPQLNAVVASVDRDLEVARLETRRMRRFFSSQRKKDEAADAVRRLTALLSDPGTEVVVQAIHDVHDRLTAPPLSVDQLWDDFLQRSVTYNGLLIEVGGLGPDADASVGFLPDEIVERIKALELDTTLMKVSLRGYQSFGARFALVQENTILGDEMGLGKTIEALAVLCHLRSRGDTHFLIVSPASVLTNWEHEIRRHTRLDHVWTLHGSSRERALGRWAKDGGVALTTFDTLRLLPVKEVKIAALVVDEAHYVKNPEARRTKAVRSWVARSDRTLLMSGTPMENRVEEFRTLVDHVRPDVASTIRTTDGLGGADAFRQSVAPVYLRRNQVDVLDELPPKIETAEWLTLTGAALDCYRLAVSERNFMMMRRAAFLTADPGDSPKLRRLLEIAAEAGENDRKVVVFSYFRDVIAAVHDALGPLAVGPLTGSVSASARQALVDEFSMRDEPAVLVSQIEAGGVGLNIQAASVVVLTEPQWKPSTEDQAIARCHRMGQVRPVEVHRLLTEDSVDERMLAVLAHKSALFADYVRDSAMKDATPEAVDVTDDERTTEVATQAEQERRIIELERRRLGLAS